MTLMSSKPYFIPDDFSLRKHFGKAWRMVPSGTIYPIQLHFDAAFAETPLNEVLEFLSDTADIQIYINRNAITSSGLPAAERDPMTVADSGEAKSSTGASVTLNPNARTP